MRKLFFAIAALCVAALTAYGQTAEVVSGSTTRIFLEKTHTTDNGTTFAYVEGTFGGGAYAQFFQEYKWWEVPLFVHGEYRTTFDGNHTAIVGPAYSFYLNNGFISLAPYYRYDLGLNTSSVQGSLTYLLDFGWLELYGYNDVWYDGAVNFYGEERLHLRLTDHIKIGLILDLSYFGEFKATPLIGLRFDM